MSAKRRGSGRAASSSPGGALSLAHEVLGLPADKVLPVLGSGVLSVGCGIGLLATSAWLITRASLRPPVFTLAIAIGAVQAFSLSRGIARYLQRLGVHNLSLEFLGKLRVRLFDDLEPRVPAGLQGAGTGSVLSGFLSDTELVAQGVAKKITVGADVLSSVAIGALVAGLIEPEVAVVTAGGALVMVLAAHLSSRLGRLAASREARARSELADLVVDTVRSARELVVFGRQDLVEERLEEIRRVSGKAGLRRAFSTGLGCAICIWIAGATIITVVSMSLRAQDSHRLSGVMVAVVVFVALGVLDPLMGLSSVLCDSVVSDSSAQRIAALAELEIPVHETQRSGRVSAPEVAARDAAAILDGVYVEARGRNVLSNVSFKVQKGHRIGLTGPSGSGKTTALYALLHFVECSHGIASVAGTDVRRLERSEIASRVGWLADETYVFAASVRDNLRISVPEASDSRCREAIERAGLAPWLEALPRGLDTAIGVGGRAMSAGERQRLGLARILLSGADVVLLDEPTSHLDPLYAPVALRQMLSAGSGRSVLVVSHDPDVRRHVDQVVALDHGRVICAPPIGDEAHLGDGA